MKEGTRTSSVAWMRTSRCACSFGTRWGSGSTSRCSISLSTKAREKPSSSDLLYMSKYTQQIKLIEYLLICLICRCVQRAILSLVFPDILFFGVSSNHKLINERSLPFSFQFSHPFSSHSRLAPSSIQTRPPQSYPPLAKSSTARRPLPNSL
jgi:hypothetical protein